MKSKLQKELDAIGKMSREELLEYGRKLIEIDECDGTLVEIDLNDEELLKKITFFRKECKKRSWNGSNRGYYGVTGMFAWNRRFGFTCDISLHVPYRFPIYHPRKGIKHIKLDDWFAAFDLQRKVLEKVRKNMAYLIRLKNELGLPGPVQYEQSANGSKGWGTYFFELSQEEIDEILKYCPKK